MTPERLSERGSVYKQNIAGGQFSLGEIILELKCVPLNFCYTMFNWNTISKTELYVINTGMPCAQKLHIGSM